MKIDDLRNKWINEKNFKVCIQHTNNKDVKFWPTDLTQTKTHYLIKGWWICLQTKEPTVQEEIKMKIEDIDGWNLVD